MMLLELNTRNLFSALRINTTYRNNAIWIFSTAMYGVYYCIYEYRKYLVDSLLVIQTPEACSALIRFALEGRATFEELMLAVESLSFVHTPSRELVSALQPMLRSYANEIQASRTSLWLARGTGPNALSEAQQQKLVTKLHLTLGTLLSRYCAASPAECAADPIWTLMASVYSWLLGPGCESDFCRVMVHNYFSSYVLNLY